MLTDLSFLDHVEIHTTCLQTPSTQHHQNHQAHPAFSQSHHTSAIEIDTIEGICLFWREINITFNLTHFSDYLVYLQS